MSKNQFLYLIENKFLKVLKTDCDSIILLLVATLIKYYMYKCFINSNSFNSYINL